MKSDTPACMLVWPCQVYRQKNNNQGSKCVELVIRDNPICLSGLVCMGDFGMLRNMHFTSVQSFITEWGSMVDSRAHRLQ